MSSPSARLPEGPLLREASKTVGSFEDLRSFDELVIAAAVESDIVDNIDPNVARTARRIAAICGWVPSAA